MTASIVTPTLNAARYIRACIESVQRNDRKPISVEHVIVDAGSTDGTVEIAQSYGVRVLQRKDRGIFDAINKGSLASSGDLIGFLGADDLLLYGAMEKVAKSYNPGRDRWISGGVQWITDKGFYLGSTAPPPQWMTPEIFASLGWCCIWHMATFISRDFFIELGGFDISYTVSGDYDLFARALSRIPYRRISAPLSVYGRTGENNSRKFVAGLASDSRRVRAQYGPKDDARLAVYRTAMKVWLNATNPLWCANKVTGRFQ